MDNSVLAKQVTRLESHFDTACQQVLVINSKIDALETRYNRATSNNMRTHRYSLKIKLSAHEGIRNMLVQYATLKFEELRDIHVQMKDTRRRSLRLQRQRARVRDEA